MRYRFSRLSQPGLLLLVLLLLVGAVWLALEQVGLPLVGIDDAHIFFVYARNLTAGDGLVYNPGGQPVEGFSSPLWLLIVALGYLVSSTPQLFLLAVSILLVAAALALLVWHVSHNRANGLSGLVVIGWTLSSPSYISWMSLALMDTALWSAVLITSVVLALSGRVRALTLAAVAMLLARPEGMLWAPALITVAALPALVEKGPRAALRHVRTAILAALVTLAVLTLWRLRMFGYPLPNTYYVKMSPDILYNLGHGFSYLIGFLYANPMVLVGLVPAIAALLVNGRWFCAAVLRPGTSPGSDPRLAYVAVSAIVLLALLVPVYMGGDHFGNFRFYQPAWPLYILPALALLKMLKVGPPRAAGPVVVAVFVLAAFLFPGANWLNQAYASSMAHEIRIAQEGQAVGRAMNALFGDDTLSAGVIRAGAVAVVYKGEIVDLIGLNNTAMAHSPGDRKGLKNHAAFNADVFFDQQPELVLPMTFSQEGQTQEIQERLAWDNAVLKGLLADPRFTAGYELVTISHGQTTILAYASDAARARLLARGLNVEADNGKIWSPLGS